MNAMARALMGKEPLSTPSNAMAAFGRPPPQPENALGAFAPSGLFNLGITPFNAMAAYSRGLGAFHAVPASGGGGGILSPYYAPQPPFDNADREAAWIALTGHVDCPEGTDLEGVQLKRNAKEGEPGYWHAAHVVDKEIGGFAGSGNLIAQNARGNLRDGGILGAWKRKCE